ncbi:MAG TPA: GYD domain-containing protein [Casimicrobiaceae bacterium]|nr:GYD domain-containing protein [Casimicrobiaceae bacterium]
MAKYLVQVRYTADGAKGLLTDGGTGRRAATEKAVASVGGKMESFYFAIGEIDAYVIVDVPDEVSLVALELVVNATGRINSRSVRLITPEDVDAATKKAVAYRAPGG